MKAAVYARVSTSNGSQTCENQLLELRRYCEARGWAVYAEYTDEMSGAKDRRPGLDRLLLDARRARVPGRRVLGFGSNRTRPETSPGGARGSAVAEHSIRFAERRSGLGSASGRLQLTILAALSQFERERLKERTIAGLNALGRRGNALGGRQNRCPLRSSRR